MDLRFFLALMAEVEPAEPATFVDVGSGRGQLVLAAAREGKWKRCVGVEIEKCPPFRFRPHFVSFPHSLYPAFLVRPFSF
eukprot:1892976-Rhodomonas_salina.3